MIEGMRPLQARLRAIGDTKGLARQLGLETVAEAKHRVARKTGTTGRTIRLARVTDDSVTVEVGGAGVYLELGTKKHDIRPRNAKALFFPSQKALVQRLGVGQARGRSAKTSRFVENRLSYTKGGRLTAASQKRFGNAAYVHAKVVHHPGTKAKPFLLPAAKAAIAKVGIGSVIERWNRAA